MTFLLQACRGEERRGAISPNVPIRDAGTPRLVTEHCLPPLPTCTIRTYLCVVSLPSAPAPFFPFEQLGACVPWGRMGEGAE